MLYYEAVWRPSIDLCRHTNPIISHMTTWCSFNIAWVRRATQKIYPVSFHELQWYCHHKLGTPFLILKIIYNVKVAMWKINGFFRTLVLFILWTMIGTKKHVQTLCTWPLCNTGIVGGEMCFWQLPWRVECRRMILTSWQYLGSDVLKWMW